MKNEIFGKYLIWWIKSKSVNSAKILHVKSSSPLVPHDYYYLLFMNFYPGWPLQCHDCSAINEGPANEVLAMFKAPI